MASERSAIEQGIPMCFTRMYSRPSKQNSESAADHAASQRRPRVNGVTSINVTCRTHDRIPVRLADVSQVFGGHEQSQSAEPVLAQHAHQRVRLAHGTIRVRVEPLFACDADI